MKEPTMEEVLELVEFERGENGDLFIVDVKGIVLGSVKGFVGGFVGGCVGRGVRGNVYGKISGRKWQFVETPKERVIRLIREGRGEEAIKVLEGE